MLKLTDEKRNKIALDLLKDGIMSARMEKGMEYFLSAHSPQEFHWQAGDQLSGMTNAYGVLGVGDKIKDEPLSDELYHIFHQYLKEDFDKDLEFRQTAYQLAEHILVDWTGILQKYELEQTHCN